MLAYPTLEKLLRGWGYTHTRTRGSHHQFTQKGRATVTVPVHSSKVRVDVWRCVLRNIERRQEDEESATTAPLSSPSEPASSSDNNESARPSRPPPVRPPPVVLATEERAAYEALLAATEKRVAEQREQARTDMMAAEARFHELMAWGSSEGVSEARKMLEGIIRQKRFARHRGEGEDVGLLDLELYYAEALEAEALQTEFASGDQFTRLTELFRFIDRMRSKWWREPATVDAQHEKFEKDILQELRSKIQEVRTENDPLESGKLQKSVVRFLRFLLRFFSDDSRQHRTRRFQQIASVFRIELLAVTQQGHSPSEVLLYEIIDHKEVSDYEEARRNVSHFLEVYRLLAPSLGIDFRSRLTSNEDGADYDEDVLGLCCEEVSRLGGSIRCRCGRDRCKYDGGGGVIGQSSETLRKLYEDELHRLRWVEEVCATAIAFCRREGGRYWNMFRESHCRGGNAIALGMRFLKYRRLIPRATEKSTLEAFSFSTQTQSRVARAEKIYCEKLNKFLGFCARGEVEKAERVISAMIDCQLTFLACGPFSHLSLNVDGGASPFHTDASQFYYLFHECIFKLGALLFFSLGGGTSVPSVFGNVRTVFGVDGKGGEKKRLYRLAFYEMVYFQRASGGFKERGESDAEETSLVDNNLKVIAPKGYESTWRPFQFVVCHYHLPALLYGRLAVGSGEDSVTLPFHDLRPELVTRVLARVEKKLFASSVNGHALHDAYLRAMLDNDNGCDLKRLNRIPCFCGLGVMRDVFEMWVSEAATVACKKQNASAASRAFSRSKYEFRKRVAAAKWPGKDPDLPSREFVLEEILTPFLTAECVAFGVDGTTEEDHSDAPIEVSPDHYFLVGVLAVIFRASCEKKISKYPDGRARRRSFGGDCDPIAPGFRKLLSVSSNVGTAGACSAVPSPPSSSSASRARKGKKKSKKNVDRLQGTSSGATDPASTSRQSTEQTHLLTRLRGVVENPTVQRCLDMLGAISREIAPIMVNDGWRFSAACVSAAALIGIQCVYERMLDAWGAEFASGPTGASSDDTSPPSPSDDSSDEDGGDILSGVGTSGPAAYATLERVADVLEITMPDARDEDSEEEEENESGEEAADVDVREKRIPNVVGREMKKTQ